MDQFRKWAPVPVVVVLAMIGVSAASGAFTGGGGGFPAPLAAQDCPGGRLAFSDSGLQRPGLGPQVAVEQAAADWADDVDLVVAHPSALPQTVFDDDSTAVVAFVTDDTTVAQVTFVYDPQAGWRLVTQQACSP